MKTARIVIGALGAGLVALVLVVWSSRGTGGGEVPAAFLPARPVALEGSPEDLLYGRVTTDDGAVYQGTLRWGGDQEALWGDAFNGYKGDNPWAERVPPGEEPRERMTIRVFGREISGPEREMDLGRPFMARFGDVGRIERLGGDIRVTLKSGTEVVLDRMGSDDLGDGLRVWDETHGVVDLAERQIRTVELMAAPGSTRGPDPVYGTVHTRQGDFTGLVQWNRTQSLGSDELLGMADGEVLHLPFDTILSVARRIPNASAVTLLDGTELVLTGTRDVNDDNRGVYVDDPRYGRVLVSWEAFDSVTFRPDGSGPGYDDFPVGGPLAGSVSTRSGGRSSGRLVFDLDESETTETLDAPSGGVDYMIPFALVQTIVPVGAMDSGGQRVRVTLRTGEELRLEPDGDLGPGNAGVLVLGDGSRRGEYVPWSDVGRIDLEAPAGAGPGRADRPD